MLIVLSINCVQVIPKKCYQNPMYVIDIIRYVKKC